MSPRTITTHAELDALDEGVIIEASGRYRYGSGTFTRCWVRPVPSSLTGGHVRVWEVLVHGSGLPLSLAFTEDLSLPVKVLHDPSAPVLAPVVSDAAVEAAARALIGDPAVDEYYWRQRAHEALTAAAPFLAAQPVPEASREDVAEVLGRVWDDGNAAGLDGWTGPGRGSGEVDDEALRHRTRSVDRALAVITERGER